MNRHPTKARPHGANRRASGAAGSHEYLNTVGQLYGRKASTYIPADWRDRLPDPAGYYGQHVAKLGKPNATGWAQGVCPFHDDHNASLSVHVTDTRGGWRCFASCGGGDLLGYHMRRTGLDFKAAVRDLLGMQP